MLEQVIARWHRYVEGSSPGELDDLLAEDVVFYSPIVYTPQRGRAITTAYLTAAVQVLAGGGSFRYTREVLGGDVAVLEFETSIDGTYVNGVDVIRVADGRIVEFRVMVRPLQAVDAVHQQMGAALAPPTTTESEPALQLQPMVHVEQMAPAVSFYEALGASVRHGSRDGDFVMLRIGDTELGLLAHPPNPAQAEGLVELNFETKEPLEALETRLRDAGVRIVQPTTDQGFGRQLQLETPDGLLVKVNQLEPERYT